MSGDDTSDATATQDSITDGQPGRNPRFDDWPLTDEGYADATYVGTTMGGVPVYNDEDRVFHGKADYENEAVSPVPDSERNLEPGETLADVLEEIGETLGWDSLSPFGEEHRRDD